MGLSRESCARWARSGGDRLQDGQACEDFVGDWGADAAFRAVFHDSAARLVARAGEPGGP